MERSESKAFGRQDPQDQGGQDVTQKRRQGPSGTLVLAEELGDGTSQSDKEHRSMMLSWGPSEFGVPVRHPRRATFTGSAGVRGKGLGGRAR